MNLNSVDPAIAERLCDVIDFVFEGGNRTHICISKSNIAYRRKKSKDNVAFSKSTLKTSLKHLMQNFILGKSLFI